MSTLITTLIIRILKGAVPGFVVLSAVIQSGDIRQTGASSFMQKCFVDSAILV